MRVGEPLFRLQIVHANSDQVAKFDGGGALEVDLTQALASAITEKLIPLYEREGTWEEQFIQTVTDAVVAKGVGLMRTEARVAAAVRTALREYVKEQQQQLHTESRIEAVVSSAVSGVFDGLKKETRKIVR